MHAPNASQAGTGNGTGNDAADWGVAVVAFLACIYLLIVRPLLHSAALNVVRGG